MKTDEKTDNTINCKEKLLLFAHNMISLEIIWIFECKKECKLLYT